MEVSRNQRRKMANEDKTETVTPMVVGLGRKIIRIISEPEFDIALRAKLQNVKAKMVVGPGRSGAIASVYASHILGIPFLPYGQPCPDHLRPLLIVDTARKSGATLRKAERRYGGECIVIHVYDEPPRLRFWYEPEAHNA